MPRLSEPMTKPQRLLLLRAAEFRGTSMYLWPRDRASGKALARRGWATIEGDDYSTRLFLTITPAGREAIGVKEGEDNGR